MTGHERGCRALDHGPAFCTCPEPRIVWDDDEPLYELWLDGERLVTMQDRARFARAFNATTSARVNRDAAKRYSGGREVQVRIVEPGAPR